MPQKSLNPSEEYFLKIQEGWTIKAISDYYGTAVSTVRKYLAQHPNYVPPGRGNRVSAILPNQKDVRVSKDYKYINTPIHPDLSKELDDIAYETKTTKNHLVRTALKEFCKNFRKEQAKQTKKD